MKNFAHRHIGIREDELKGMLEIIGVPDLETLIDNTIPSDIRIDKDLGLPESLTERAYLKHIRRLGQKNKVFRSYIGQGYSGTFTPPVIQRCLFENPGWYTQYTPYQAEISQGRLESLLNFQTVVSDLTGLPIANASLLDEGTAAAEAMSMFFHQKNKRNVTAPRFFIDQHVYTQTLEVIRSRAIPLGIEIVTGSWKEFEGDETYFGALCQYPNSEGAVEDYRNWTAGLNAKGMYVVVATDLLSLTLLTPPGEWGADAVVGSAQRFGVPMGFGGPHAAFFSTKEDFKRTIPGRIIGVSKDTRGKRALRMALQTREQHIKREKATSNICTAQALLANMAAMYAVYHGPEGLREIATDINTKAVRLADQFRASGLNVVHTAFFDTVRVSMDKGQQDTLRKAAEAKEINFYYDATGVQISLGETVLDEDIRDILEVFNSIRNGNPSGNGKMFGIPDALHRSTEYLTHPVFHKHTTETEMMRYMKSLENKDLSLVHSMISLGSCTMKLNAAAQLMPVSSHAFAHMHPFAPASQTEGYREMISDLESYLCQITGLSACSLMPNSGAQGELAGLLTIQAYHNANGQNHRNVALIPSSAHGTNPASAVMAGMDVVVVKCDEHGNIDVEDLEKRAVEFQEKLACLMVTYPSTHGVFETSIRRMIEIVHQHGGLVYMDGANMNAQVGLTSPGAINADVCHLNLHKTFAIPHGGGGPGMGPICVNEKLAPYLPKHPFADVGGKDGIDPVAAAPWGSASILLISYAYIRLLGNAGVMNATQYAILNANYLAARLSKHYEILFTGPNGRVAHEFILDLRPFKDAHISAEDVAKRLIDYGFHAPTLSFPVAGTIMIEPTESESLEELDRFCDAMIQIRKEIDEVVNGEADPENNVLVNAPHTLDLLTDANWKFPYSREKAVFPLPYLYEQHKFWPSVTRIDGAFGDRNLVCTCPPIEEYQVVD